MSRFSNGRPAAVAALVALCVVLVAAEVAAEEPLQITASETAQHVGEYAEVCGRVASAAHIAAVKGQPTFLNFERPYPDNLFTVVIWGSCRSLFDGRPENMFDGKSVCVTGRIVEYQGKPQIVVENPDQIVVESPVGGGELRDLEKVFLKAVLSSLGHETNYGSGEWDEETVEAMIAFQENAGIPPSGEPDPATLRALADAAEEMPDSERDLIIRLLLFELARRQE